MLDVAKRNTLRLDTSGFEELLTRLDELGGDVKEVVEDALTQAAETIADDTVDALDKAYLPAGGKYSKGDTLKSVIRHPKVNWQGQKASVAVGFDYSKKGAGGFLISGTPRMKPDYELERIYARKKYMSQLQKDMMSVVEVAIEEKLGG